MPARAANLVVIVGLWRLGRDLDRAGHRLESAGVIRLERRVGGGVEEIERLRHAPGPSRTHELQGSPRLLIVKIY